MTDKPRWSSESARRAAFLSLVFAQDALGVDAAREYIERRYLLTRARVLALECEGLEKEWPPLDE